MGRGTPDAPAPPVSGTAIDRDLACVRCGYNLRTLSLEARCPECGAAVELTVTLGGELAKSRPGYLRRLARACRLLFAARMLMFGAVLASSVSISVWTRISLALAGLFYALGAWLLVAREHPRMSPEFGWSSRLLRLASLTLVVSLSMAITCLGLRVALLLSGGMMLGVIPGFLRTSAFDTWFMVAFGVYVLCPIVETRLMVRMAKRLTDAWLGEHALIAGVGASLSGGLCIVLLLARVTIEHTVGFVAVLVALVFILLFWLWLSVCSWIAAIGFRRFSRLAAERWRQATEAS